MLVEILENINESHSSKDLPKLLSKVSGILGDTEHTIEGNADIRDINAILEEIMKLEGNLSPVQLTGGNVKKGINFAIKGDKETLVKILNKINFNVTGIILVVDSDEIEKIAKEFKFKKYTKGVEVSPGWVKLIGEY